MFESVSKDAFDELKNRETITNRILSFGIEFLDDALRGIFPDDLILLGAPSGVGKTQLCCNIALSNMQEGKKVHYIALEAAEYEITRRLKYPLVMERYFSDENRVRFGQITYTDWLLGKYIKQMRSYEEEAALFLEKAYRDLFVYHKSDRFGISELIESVNFISDKTDLIIIDHVHYFDFDYDNENRAIKEIAKTVRSLALENQKPIILVAHLRKRDKRNEELAAGMEEFHGSSDLYKIATRVITVSPGKMKEDGNFETFFRIPKNRLDGGVSRFLAKELYNPKKGMYERNKYQLGWAEQKRENGFEQIENKYYPSWAKHRANFVHSSNSTMVSKRKHWFDND